MSIQKKASQSITLPTELQWQEYIKSKKFPNVAVELGPVWSTFLFYHVSQYKSREVFQRAPSEVMWPTGGSDVRPIEALQFDYADTFFSERPLKQPRSGLETASIQQFWIKSRLFLVNRGLKFVPMYVHCRSFLGLLIYSVNSIL